MPVARVFKPWRGAHTGNRRGATFAVSSRSPTLQLGHEEERNKCEGWRWKRFLRGPWTQQSGGDNFGIARDNISNFKASVPCKAHKAPVPVLPHRYRRVSGCVCDLVECGQLLTTLPITQGEQCRQHRIGQKIARTRHAEMVGLIELLPRCPQWPDGFLAGNDSSRRGRAILVRPFFHHFGIGKDVQRVEMGAQPGPVFGRKAGHCILELLKAYAAIMPCSHFAASVGWHWNMG